ncbi:MAG: YfhO family protein [Mucilaginibacter polytrichastri]|nr:YfhO family protein [Mucilaginibacter polytrichastri]
MNEWFKRNGIHLGIILIFAAICFFYFTPAFSGKSLMQNDILLAQQTQREIMEYKAKDGKAPLWTNSMFGGMPTYQIWAQYSDNVTTHIISFLNVIMPNPANLVFMYLLGGYLLFSVLRLKPWLAMAGAIAFAFSSYNFIYIEAGHGTQAMAIAFFAPIVAGVLLVFRGQYLLGGLITAFFMALEIRANHVQMTYYLFLVLLILAIVEAWNAYKTKTFPVFGKSIGTLALAGVLAIGVNAANLWTTYEYAEESIRGKSNLTKNTSEPQTGVSRDYAYQWSQGVGEILTFLIPDAYGGSSDGRLLDDKSDVVKALTGKGVPMEQAAGFAQQLPTYWGDKPFTSGPWYFGAVVIFLFVFGLITVKSRMKWWIVAAVALTVLLSFGKNFTLVSDLFFDFFPMYNKFRAVESILAVTSLCIPILAFLGVKELSESTDTKRMWKAAKLSLYITGGICLVVAGVPDLLSLRPDDSSQLQKSLTQAFQGDSRSANEIIGALMRDRASIARADAIRSLIFILIAFAIVWAWINKKLNLQLASVAVALVIVVDMWAVDKRYLNSTNFGPKQNLAERTQKRDVDEFILRDQDKGFRVIDFTSGNPFTNASASYFYRSLGGYHAAKLKRYQELVDHNFTNSVNQDVLDMLNTRYIIQSDPKDGSEKMQRNNSACGPAWFVKKIEFVKNSDEEMEAISSFDPHNVAVVDTRYRSLFDAARKSVDPNAKIELTGYHPDTMRYEYSSATAQTVVFSEIYYDKGWNMYLDGEKKPYFRADYLLRAAEVPLGNHKIEFRFEPVSYYTGEKISLAASAILILGGIGVLILEIRRRQRAPVPKK